MQLRLHRPPILALTLCLTLPSPSGFAGRDDHGLPEPPSPARGSGSYAPALAFTGVNVLPMDSENLLRDQTVVVEDGVIEAVGPRDEVRVLQPQLLALWAGRTIAALYVIVAVRAGPHRPLVLGQRLLHKHSADTHCHRIPHVLGRF